MIGSAKKAIKEYQSIDDMSEYEASANQRIQNLFDEWGERNRRAAESERITEKRLERKDQELEKLRKKRDVISARERKKLIFSNLHYIFTEASSVTQDVICKYIGIPQIRNL